MPPTSQMPVPAGEPREPVLLRAGAVRLPDRELVARARPQHAEILGQHDEARAFRGGGRHQRLGPGEILGDVAAADGLHGGDAESFGRWHRDRFLRWL